MQIELIRHATLLVDYAGVRLLVDPMLSEAGAMAPIQNSPQPRNNPLVPLPRPVKKILEGVQAVLVTHTHRDHWDDAAAQLVPKDLQIFCQPEDLEKMQAAGFPHATAIADTIHLSGMSITRTPARHGTGEIAEAMAPASGYILKSAHHPTLYIAGDSVWYEEVDATIVKHRPEVIIVNAGGARFLEGDPITMTAEDVIHVARAAPQAVLVAVHMEAINHCLLTRKELADAALAAGVKVLTPADGESSDRADCSDKMSPCRSPAQPSKPLQPRSNTAATPSTGSSSAYLSMRRSSGAIAARSKSKAKSTDSNSALFSSPPARARTT
jgi:L-ascorbate metabolism protein UlaG (beta-lactamase superfamily)